MKSDAVAESVGDRDGRVMASIEDGPVRQLIIADVTCDGAFATLPLEDAVSLPAWR